MKDGEDMKITWLGHEGFRIETDAGAVVLVDPWLDHPMATPEVRAIDRADLILVTHGHGDHIGSLVPLAEKTGAAIACIHEISVYLGTLGLSNEIIGMNKGGSVEHDSLRVTMVHADHSSMIQNGDRLIPAGECVGFVIDSGGYRIYHSGDTNVFGDMAIIRELYEPRLALLPIGDRYTMGPREAALAVKLLRPERIIPMHYGTFPILTGTVEAFREALDPEFRDRLTPLEVGAETNLP